MKEKTKDDRNHTLNNKHDGNLLANVTVETLRKVRVLLVNKPSSHSIPSIDAALVTLKRRLENPNQLAVPADGQYPIFNRTDIDVNNEDNIEERIELTFHETVVKDGEYKRDHFTNSKEDRTIKYIIKDQKEVCKFKGNVDEHDLIREKEGSVKPPTSREGRDKEQQAKLKRRRSTEEKYDRSPSRTPRKYYKTSCNDRQCSCSQILDSKHRNQSSQFRENRERKTETQRRARTPSREKSTYSSRDYTRERKSRSPYSRKRSYSPQSRRSSLPTKHFENRDKRRNNLSSHDEGRKGSHHEERRNKSSSIYTNQYGMPAYTYGYHGPEGLWIPGPQFIPRNIVPPPNMPMLGGPSYFVPRSQMFIPRPLHYYKSHEPYRHRMSVTRDSRSATNTVHTSTARPPNAMEEPSSTSNDN